MSITVNGHNDELWLNDIKLLVAPTQINISQQSHNLEWQTLRTRNSMQAKTGHAVINIQLNITFVGEQAVNETLRPLIAQLRLTPFCYVQNEYIKNNLFPEENPNAGETATEETLALVFRSAEIQADPSTAPITVHTVFNFSYFNYKPFIPFFLYKGITSPFSDLGISGVTGTPVLSQAWKDFYDPVLNGFWSDDVSKYQKISEAFETTASMKFLEFRLVPGSSLGALGNQRHFLEELEKNPDAVIAAFVKNIPGAGSTSPGAASASSAVLAAAQELGIANWGPRSASGGLLLNSIVEDPGSREIGEVDLLLPLLEAGSVRYRQRRDEGLQHETLVNQEAVRDTMASIDQRIAEARQFTEEQSRLPVDEQFTDVSQLSTSRGSGVRVVKRNRGLSLDPKDGIVLTNIIVNIRNIVAVLPVVGHRYATFQHVGSMDAEVHLDMMVNGDVPNKKLAWFYSTAEDNILRMKRLPQGLQTIEIDNDLLQLLGLRYFITKAYNSDTIPGNPGTYAVSLQLTESGIGPDDMLDVEDLKPEFLGVDQEIKKRIITTLLKYIAIEDDEALIDTSKVDIKDPRNAALADLLDRTLDAFRALVNGLETTARGQDGASLNAALLAASDNDIPGILFVQVIYRSIMAQGIDQRFNPTYDGRGKTPEEVLSDKQQRIRNQVVSEDDLRDQETILRIRRETGLPDSALNLETAVLNQRKLSSVAALKELPAVVKWNAFIRRLAKEVVGVHIGLDVFDSVREKLAAGNDYDKGSSAYPDFKPSIEHVAGLLDMVKAQRTIDPDCYFFQPAIDNARGLIDSGLLAIAKASALAGYESIKKNLNAYLDDSLPAIFSDGYRKRMVSAQFDEKAKGSLPPGQNYLPPDINETVTYYNAIAQAASEADGPMKVGVLQIDADKHSRIKPKDFILNAETSIVHTGSPAQLFNGVNVGAPRRFIEQPEAAPGNAPIAGSKGGPLDFAGGAALHSPLGSALLQVSGPTGEPGADRRGRKPHFGGAIDLKADLNQPVYAMAEGTAEIVGFGTNTGFQVVIRHKGIVPFYTKYFHLAAPNITQVPQNNAERRFFAANGGPRHVANYMIKEGDHISGGQLIGYVGRTGVESADTPTHLHLEIRKSGAFGQPVNPRELLAVQSSDGRISQPIRTFGARGGPGTGPSAAISVLDASLKEFNKGLHNGQALRMIRAYPTFKLYFIEDDSEDRKRFALDDFFSYNAVKSIRVVRSRKIAADLAIIELTNVSGNLTNRKFAYKDQISQEKPKAQDDVDTSRENPLSAIAVQEGMDMELRLGYSNDPDRLTTVMVGKVMEIAFNDTEDLITITCQSHAIELVQQIKGLQPDTKGGYLSINQAAETHQLLTEMITEPEVIHFGRWERSRELNEQQNQAMVFNGILKDDFKLSPTPQDDNIFAPSSRQLDRTLFWFSKLKHSIFRTTIWDVFQEMTLRHPGYIASPVPYKSIWGPRMTMFYGLPGQLYYARDATSQEAAAVEQIRSQVTNDPERSLRETLADPSSSQRQRAESLGIHVDTQDPDAPQMQQYVQRFLTQTAQTNDLDMYYDQTLKDAVNEKQQRMIEQLAKETEAIRPFRNYHLLTARNHILHNNIKASATNTHNTVSIQFGETDFDDDLQQFTGDDWKVETVKLDAAMPDEEVRELYAQYPNCRNKSLAIRYAQALLMNAVKDIYSGELVVIGNPDIKPFDIAYVFDEYSDMVGPIEVEQVTHFFSQETGFITEIVPDLFVAANEWTSMTLADAMDVLITGSLNTVYSMDRIKPSDIVRTTGEAGVLAGAAALAPAAIAAGKGAALTAATAGGIYAGAATGIAAGASVGAVAGAIGAGLAVAATGGAVLLGGIALADHFMSEKLLNTSDHMQPVFLNPLLHNGRPLVAGLAARKLDAGWLKRGNNWIKDGIEGLEMTLEDWIDKLTLAPTLGNLATLFSGSSIPPKFE